MVLDLILKIFALIIKCWNLCKNILVMAYTQKEDTC